MAFLAASLICWGVSKSGSPKLRSITSIPCALNSRPSLAIFRVSGSLKRFNKDDNSCVAVFACICYGFTGAKLVIITTNDCLLLIGEAECGKIRCNSSFSRFFILIQHFTQMFHKGESHTVVIIFTIVRSEEHTSELQSHHDLVCRLLLE